MKPVKEDGPSRFEHLNQDVVVDVGHEVGHFVMGQVESVELSSETCIESSELLLILHGDTPGERQGVLNLLKLQHERENFVVVVHNLLREDRRQRCQV